MSVSDVARCRQCGEFDVADEPGNAEAAERRASVHQATGAAAPRRHDATSATCQSRGQVADCDVTVVVISRQLGARLTDAATPAVGLADRRRPPPATAVDRQHSSAAHRATTASSGTDEAGAERDQHDRSASSHNAAVVCDVKDGQHQH